MYDLKELKNIATSIIKDREKFNNLKIVNIKSGGNNRVYKVILNEKKEYLLKYYFSHRDDKRDRLGSEYSFINYVWRNEIVNVPEPILCDKEKYIAIYEFIDGIKLNKEDIDYKYIKSALFFFNNINKYRFSSEASKLPVASEACFSFSEHLKCLERRIKRLEQITIINKIDEMAKEFIDNKLKKYWNTLKNTLLEKVKDFKIDINKEIKAEERCISPSDFGFHNAILDKNNILRFIDFEYAGWDDPVKMICDFFNHPAVPISIEYIDKFISQIILDGYKENKIRGKVKLLFPVYRLKWCCIILNDFLPVGNERRSFASNDDYKNRKEQQYNKVEKYYNEYFNKNKEGVLNGIC